MEPNERAEARRTLIYDTHWKECICETLRVIYDQIQDYPDKELKEKITEHLVTAMVQATKMVNRLAYYRDTYKDETGSSGGNLKLIKNFKEIKKMRQKR